MLHKECNLKRLVTKEDNFHIHKILGVLVLCSYMYRYAFSSPIIEYDLSGWLTMCLHFALSLSGLQFRVPKKRINDKPLIVYEEYRLHAVIFTSRSFFVYAVGDTSLAPIVVLTHHLLADLVTKNHGKENDTAVRSIAVRSGKHKMLSRMFSLYQFLAIGSHLFGPPATMGFNTLIAIQSSIFLMTLYKKKIIRGRAHLLIYSFALILSVYQMVLETEMKYLLLSTLCFIIRISVPNNKYILWSVIYFIGRLV